MPDKEYQEQHIFKEYWPSNWRDLNENSQKELSLKFGNIFMSGDLMCFNSL